MSNLSVQRPIGNFSSRVGNEIDAVLTTTSTVLQGIRDSVSSFTSNIWAGGFVGIKDFNELETAIANYVAGVQEAVNEYNEAADISTTVKGSAADGLTEFISATKELLNAYATLVNKWKEELAEVKTRYNETTGTIQSNVSESAASVSQAAKNVSLD